MFTKNTISRNIWKDKAGRHKLFNQKGMKMSYSPQWQYTFIKIFYETQEEEKLALELTLGVKSIIDKYGKTKLEKTICVLSRTESKRYWQSTFSKLHHKQP